MIRTFELIYATEIEKAAKKIYDFSCEWDSGEYTDDEWEAKRLLEATELAINILRDLHRKASEKE